MPIGENLTEFQGKSVIDFDPDQALGDPRKVAYRMRLDYEEADGGAEWTDKLAQLLEKPGSERIESLVVGAWGEVGGGVDSAGIVEALAAARDRLKGLKHLFFGDITVEESEMSWIAQSDVSPLFEAYPNLEHLTLRGGEGLSLGHVDHEHLRELVIQTGGLPPAVIHEVAASRLPALERLELWLGEPNYGGDATVEDLAPLLSGTKFPKLKYLGIKDSVIADEVAGVLVNSPVLKQLEVLDLSMGTLGNEGARALLGSPEVRRLKKLDVHYHFIAPDVVAQLEALGIEVDASEPQEAEDWDDAERRFIQVSE